MVHRLEGKVALVTGAANGIGAGIAKALAAEGAQVVINFKGDKESAGQVVAEIAKVGGRAVLAQGDVANKEDAVAIVTAAIENFGRLDILVNNAGVADFQPIDQFTEEFYHRIFNPNLLGIFQVTSEALKYLRQGASIINISSVATEFGPPGMSVYTATKGAIDALTTVLANELGPRGIRVNSLKPGVIATGRSIAAGFTESDFAKNVISQTPMARLGTPEDMGHAVVFLASDESSFITGDHILAAGGFR